VISVVGDIPVDNDVSVVTSSILRDLPAQFSKMLLGVGFVCIHRDECVCVVIVSDVSCNSKKRYYYLCS
jgi:hypothetical protein